MAVDLPRLGLAPGISWSIEGEAFYFEYPASETCHEFARELVDSIAAFVGRANEVLLYPTPTWQSRCLLRILHDLDVTVKFPTAHLVDELKKNSAVPILISKAEMRILNVHYDVDKKCSSGEPYLVLWDGERFCREWSEINTSGRRVAVNFLKSSAALMRAYFLSPIMQTWLALDEPGKHNYWSEEQLFAEVAAGFGESPLEAELAHNLHWKASLKNDVGGRVQCAPLDLFLRDKFQISADINQHVQHVYRTVETTSKGLGGHAEQGVGVEPCEFEEWRQAILEYAPETVVEGQVPFLINTHCALQWYGAALVESVKPRFYRLTQNAQPIGWIGWYKTGPGVARGRNLVIKPEFRGKGFGETLYNWSGELYEKGIRRQLAFVTPAGESFYRRIGFAPILGIPSAGLWRGTNLKAMGRELNGVADV